LYSARYIAGRVLGAQDEELVQRITKWIPGIQGSLSAFKSVIRDISWFDNHNEPVSGEGPNEWMLREMRRSIPTFEQETRSFRLIDMEGRTNAIHDTGYLFNLSRNSQVRDLLVQVYQEIEMPGIYDIFEEVDEHGMELKIGCRRKLAKLAGKELGYSNLSMFVDKHPVAATIIGTLGLGASLALGYSLVQSFLAK
jgi:hypothetical protein